MKFEFPAIPATEPVGVNQTQLQFGGYPFERMGLGDFFAVPIDCVRKTISNCNRIAQLTFLKFATRKLSSGGLRVMWIK